MQMVLSESFKALVEKTFSNKEQSENLIKIFEEVVNDRATTTRLDLEEMKQKATQDIKGELATKDFVRAELSEVKEELSSKISDVKTDILKWVISMQIATILAIVAAVIKLS